jgi:hypothetical protein
MVVSLANRFAFCTTLDSQPNSSYTLLLNKLCANSKVASPDKNFAFSFLQTDDDLTLVIEGRVTDKRWATQELPTPIFSTEWTTDSKNVLVVGHIAGGTVAQLIHLTSNGLVSNRILPKLKGHAKYVVLHTLKSRDELKISYLIRLESQAHNYSYYIETLRCDLQTQKVSRVSLSALAEEQYVSMMHALEIATGRQKQAPE